MRNRFLGEEDKKKRKKKKMAKIKGGDRHLEIFSTLLGDGGVLKLSPFCIPLLLKEGSESCWRSKNVRRVYENEERFFFCNVVHNIVSCARCLFFIVA